MRASGHGPDEMQQAAILQNRLRSHLLFSKKDVRRRFREFPLQSGIALAKQGEQVRKARALLEFDLEAAAADAAPEGLGQANADLHCSC